MADERLQRVQYRGRASERFGSVVVRKSIL